MSLEANKKLVAYFLAHFGRSDVAGAMALMADDGSWWIGGKPELFALCGTKSKAAMTELLNGLVPALKNGLRVTPKAMVAEGNFVAVEAESYGEFIANGRVYNNEYHFLFELRDGKVLRVKEYLDTQHIAAVLAP